MNDMIFIAAFVGAVAFICAVIYAAQMIDAPRLPPRPAPPSRGNVIEPSLASTITNTPLTLDNIKSLTERRVQLHGRKDNPLVARIEAELEWLESIGKTKHDDKLGMHMTVADLEMVYVHLAGLDDAITKAGPNPAQHESRIRTLAETWPYLWKRLHRLVHEE